MEQRVFGPMVLASILPSVAVHLEKNIAWGVAVMVIVTYFAARYYVINNVETSIGQKPILKVFAPYLAVSTVVSWSTLIGTKYALIYPLIVAALQTSIVWTTNRLQWKDNKLVQAANGVINH